MLSNSRDSSYEGVGYSFFPAGYVHGNSTPGDTSDDSCYGESFTMASTVTVTQFSLWVQKIFSPTDNLYYQLYNTTDSLLVDSGTVGTPASISYPISWVLVNLSANKTLTAGKTYRLFFFNDFRFVCQRLL